MLKIRKTDSLSVPLIGEGIILNICLPCLKLFIKNKYPGIDLLSVMNMSSKGLKKCMETEGSSEERKERKGKERKARQGKAGERGRKECDG